MTDHLLQWSNLATNAPNSTATQVHNVHGWVGSGQILGIVGMNSSGKTAILNALAGRIPHSGTVLYDGALRPANWASAVVLVQREIPIAQYQSVRELVFFSARLRMPNWTTDEQVWFRVNQVIGELALEAIADKIVSTHSRPLQISLGEMRRIAIAIQIVHDPQIIFVDEPTHGLDACTGHALLLWLKDLTVSGNKILIISFEQARIQSAALLDNLLVVHGGREVYFGTLQGASDTFGLSFPLDPDDLLDQLAVCGSDFIAQEELFIPIQATAAPRALVIHCSSVPQQINQLFMRDLRIFLRQGGLYIYLFAQNFFLIAIQCFWFHGAEIRIDDMKKFNNSLMLVALYYLSLIAIPLQTIHPLIRSLIRREQYECTYRLYSSFLSKMLLWAPIRIIGQIVFVLISYYIIGLKSSAAALFYTLAIQLAFVYAAVGIGLAVSGMFTTVLMAQIVGPMIVILNIFYSGNVVSGRDLTWIVRWGQFLSIVYWMFRGVFQVQVEGNPQEDELLYEFDLEGPGAWFAFLMLLVIGSVWYLVGAVFLSFRYRNPVFILGGDN